MAYYGYNVTVTQEEAGVTITITPDILPPENNKFYYIIIRDTLHNECDTGGVIGDAATQLDNVTLLERKNIADGLRLTFNKESADGEDLRDFVGWVRLFTKYRI